MPGTERPSFNNKVVKTLTLEQLIEQHPNADVAYVTAEWNRVNEVAINSTPADAPKKKLTATEKAAIDKEIADLQQQEQEGS
jgi:hypothetical protein